LDLPAIPSKSQPSPIERRKTQGGQSKQDRDESCEELPIESQRRSRNLTDESAHCAERGEGGYSSEHEEDPGDEEGAAITFLSHSARIAGNSAKDGQIAAGGDGSYQAEQERSRKYCQGKTGRRQNRGRPLEHRHPPYFGQQEAEV
jgi:hypothetical protein